MTFRPFVFSLLFFCLYGAAFSGTVFSTVFSDTVSPANEIETAVNAVVPNLVRIQTVGGVEKSGEEFANAGTATGVLHGSEGFVITSAFHFLHKPAAIIITLPDGTKQAAKRIATDKLLQLTLLKIEPGNYVSPVLKTRSKKSLRIGEHCLAVGTALSPAEPSAARGIISGIDRIWGKAVQTDAAVGPNNYGGVLIDYNGNILGILVPLSMTSDALTAGSEFYDAGIGTAIPIEDVLVILPKLKQGKDLLPGFAGIAFNENQTFVGTAVIAEAEPDSPAGKAGLAAGDKVISIDGKTTDSALDVVKRLKMSYAGEDLKITYQRGEELKTATVTTGEPPSKEH